MKHLKFDRRKALLRKLLVVIVVLSFASLGTFTLLFSRADNISSSTPNAVILNSSADKLYLKPSTQSLTTGNSFSVQIRLGLPTYASTYINFISTTVNFPVNFLKVTSVNATSTAFPLSLKSAYSNTNGAVSFTGNSERPYTLGDYLVATVNFQATAAGTAPLSFSPSSKAGSCTYCSNLVTSMTGTTITVSKPSPPPSPPPSTTVTPAPTHKTSTASASKAIATTTPAPATSPPAATPQTPTPAPAATAAASKPKTVATTISHLSYKSLPNQTVIISWQTNIRTPSLIHYGLSPFALTKTASISKPSTAHQISLTKLNPNSQYYFEVVAGPATAQTIYNGNLKTLPVSHLKLAAAITGSVLLLLMVGVFLAFRALPALPSAPKSPDPDLPPHPSPPAPPAPPVARAVIPIPMAPPPPLTRLPAKPDNPSYQHLTEASSQWPWLPNQSSAPAAPTQHPVKKTADEPLDMFEAGEQRLKQEEADRLIPRPPDN